MTLRKSTINLGDTTLLWELILQKKNTREQDKSAGICKWHSSHIE